jgi:aminoglycoside phosphotransferase (APT) family kinase protein
MLDFSIQNIKKIIEESFPQYKNLPIKEVKFQGHDNRTFHLGDNLLIRLPSHERYSKSIEKEYFILNYIKSHFSTKITESVHIGMPCEFYPYNFLINKYIEGKSLNEIKLLDKKEFILDLCKFLNELWNIDINVNYDLKPDNRGSHVGLYAYELLELLNIYEKHLILKPKDIIKKINPILGTFCEKRVFIHGDLLPGNIIIKNNKLEAIIDWGCGAIGDPACDVIIAYMYFNKHERKIFKDNLYIDEDTYNRGKIWALWKLLINIKIKPDLISININLANEVLQDLI